MAEPIIDPTATPPVTPDAPTGLPSDDVIPTAKDAFSQLGDEAFDNEKGLFDNRWNNPQEMADYIKKLEDKHSSTVRDIKNNESQTQKEIEATATEAKLVASREAKLIELAPKFVENGMQATPEMMAELKELGISETEVKLGAYEYKERFEQAYSTVGGKAEYDAMMVWAVDGLSDADKVSFNADLGSAKVSTLAIEGLYGRYQKNAQQPQGEQGRYRGQPTANSAIKPYGSREELFKDKSFADSTRATANDKAKYKARLNATPQSVYL